ncbi:hypothetical protein Bbelb_406880 [Branchiostoma belcheri]|nr:hypothetical protein Bbelb_406880 [Branchiostoma belcheri]
MDRKRKADGDEEDVRGGKKTAPNGSPPYLPDAFGQDDGALAIITIENVVIKGYHAFKRRPLQGLEMFVMREYDNPLDENAFVVQMPALSIIPADKHDVVTDEKRGTTVRSIAGKVVGRLPAGLGQVLAVMEKDGTYSGAMCAATGPPRQSFPPWPAPGEKGGGAVIPCEVYVEVCLKDKESIMAMLREAVDVHMSAVKDVVRIR